MSRIACDAHVQSARDKILIAQEENAVLRARVHEHEATILAQQEVRTTVFREKAVLRDELETAKLQRMSTQNSLVQRHSRSGRVRGDDAFCLLCAKASLFAAPLRRDQSSAQ